MATDSGRTGRIVGDLDIKLLLAFAFGVIFIGALLLITALDKNPSDEAAWIYRVVLALAAAGFAAILPGFLDFRYRSLVQAGGALGVFVMTLFGSQMLRGDGEGGDPPPPIAPGVSAEPAALRYMGLIDTGRYPEAFETVDPAAGHKWEEFKQAYDAGRKPLGEVRSRAMIGFNQGANPPGAPAGYYKFLTYKTKFSADENCRQEFVALRGADKSTWKVVSHNMSPTQIDC